MAITKWINLQHPTLEDRIEHAAMIRWFCKRHASRPELEWPPIADLLRVPHHLFYIAAVEWHNELPEDTKDRVREHVRREVEDFMNASQRLSH